MDIRLTKFKNLTNHPHYSRLMNRLNLQDMELITRFITSNGDIDKSTFEFRLNRLFLDKPKPKNWSLILEFLMISNGDSL